MATQILVLDPRWYGSTSFLVLTTIAHAFSSPFVVIICCFVFPERVGLREDRYSGQDEHAATTVHPRQPDRVLHRAGHAPECPHVRKDQNRQLVPVAHS